MYSLGAVGRGSRTQPQVGENFSYWGWNSKGWHGQGDPDNTRHLDTRHGLGSLQFKGLSQCHDLSGRFSHDSGCRSKRYNVLTQSMLICEFVPRASRLLLGISKTKGDVSPRWGENVACLRNERDNNYLVVWRTLY